jgi:H+-transporting ATPase
MFLVVLASVFLGFAPLTAAMIVIMSLLDDVPIMTIAYDNTPVSERPIRWRMPRILSVSAVLGLFSVVQAFGFLLAGLKVLSNPAWQGWFGLADRAHLQTAVFLQLVVGGHLLLFVTRSERWFFLPPFPAWPLFSAILATQVVAALMCAFGWLVPAISWQAIAAVWAYNIGWMVVLGAVRLATERLIDHRTAARLRSGALVTGPLQTHLPAPPRRAGG